jgi:hypothetical protein
MATVLHHEGAVREGIEAQVRWNTTEAGLEIPKPVYWFGISGTTVGKKICVDHLSGLVESRISIYLVIITLVLKIKK